jgi:membrane protein YdbS with pleckstrin-like domain
MYCVNCGKENPDDAVYCQKCGNLLEAEETTRVADRSRDRPDYLPPRTGAINDAAERRTPAPLDRAGKPTSLICTISPTLLFVKLGYGLAVIAAVILVGLLSIVAVSIPTWIAVLVGLLLLLVPGYYHFRQKLVKYTLTDSKIEFDSGLVSRTTRNVPLGRIQDVTVTTTILQRLLGFGDVVIDNASEDGGKLVLKNINSPRKYADLLLREMAGHGRSEGQ